MLGRKLRLSVVIESVVSSDVVLLKTGNEAEDFWDTELRIIDRLKDEIVCCSFNRSIFTMTMKDERDLSAVSKLAGILRTKNRYRFVLVALQM